MADYKVLSETGVILEGSDDVYEKDAVIVLDSEAEQTQALLAAGSIELVAPKVQEATPPPAVEPQEEGADEGEGSIGVAPGERHPLA